MSLFYSVATDCLITGQWSVTRGWGGSGAIWWITLVYSSLMEDKRFKHSLSRTVGDAVEYKVFTMIHRKTCNDIDFKDLFEDLNLKGN